MRAIYVLLFFSFITYSSESSAKGVKLNDYDWEVTDVSDMGLDKEKIFQSLDRTFIKLGSSICANRAHMWLYEMKKNFSVDGAKVFIFYTNKTSKRWWYHVAPVVADQGELFVLDAGFATVKSSLKLNQWLETFSRSQCREISSHETDLIQLMYSGNQFPVQTKYGSNDCYYKVVPAGHRFPVNVADALLGGNVPNEIQKQDVYSACVEAVTTSLERYLQMGKKSCKEYVSMK